MKINLFLLMVVLSLAWFGTFFYSKSTTPKNHTTKIQDFTFQSLSGKTLKLYDHNKRVIFIHFWATWCAPCIKELPILTNMANQNQKNVRVYAFAVQDSDIKIKKFLKNNNLALPSNFTIGMDTNKVISETIFNTKKLPETFILRSDYTLFDKIIGANEQWDNDDWQAIIKNIQ